MDVQRANEAQGPRPDRGAERAAALAEGRRRLSAESRQSAQQAQARRAEQSAEFRAEAARAVGADTKVAITRVPGAPVFLYRAIDQTTGEVVQEWPRLEFLALSQARRMAAMADTGRAVDRNA